MKVYQDVSLRSFEFWSGAVDRAKYLNSDDFEIIEATLDELYPDGMDETQINDIFWFDEDWIAELLGYNNFEELINDREEED